MLEERKLFDRCFRLVTYNVTARKVRAQNASNQNRLSMNLSHPSESTQHVPRHNRLNLQSNLWLWLGII